MGPSAPVAFWMGKILESKNRPQEAAQHYQEALQLNPGMADAQQRLDAIRRGSTPTAR